MNQRLITVIIIHIRRFVEILLEKGFNVFIHGRNKEKLEKLQAELQEKYPARQTQIIVCDAAHPDVVAAVDSIIAQMGLGPPSPSDTDTAGENKPKPKPKKLTVLINNLGSPTPYRPFLFQPTNEQLSILKLSLLPRLLRYFNLDRARQRYVTLAQDFGRAPIPFSRSNKILCSA